MNTEHDFAQVIARVPPPPPECIIRECENLADFQICGIVWAHGMPHSVPGARLALPIGVCAEHRAKVVEYKNALIGPNGWAKINADFLEVDRPPPDPNSLEIHFALIVAGHA